MYLITAPVGFWKQVFFFFSETEYFCGGGWEWVRWKSVVEIWGSRESLKVECWGSDMLMEVVVDIRYFDKDKK